MGTHLLLYQDGVEQNRGTAGDAQRRQQSGAGEHG